MSLVLIGTNYKYSDVGLREQFSFLNKDKLSTFTLLADKQLVRGAVILSTCQRLEIYAETNRFMALKDFFLNRNQQLPDLEEYIYVKENEEAVSHLFNVAAGLNSRIIGENEILGQVRQAYLEALKTGVISPLLNRLFQRALFVGKCVRNKTAISKQNPSIAKAAICLLKQISCNFLQKKVYIIGSGAVASQLARLLVSEGLHCTIVAGRTFIKAQVLANALGATAINFDTFYERLNEVDILFSATASKHIILKKDIFERFRNTGKEIIILDLAFPRDIDPAIGVLSKVKLFNLDHFGPHGFSKDRDIDAAVQIVREKAEKFLEEEEIICKKELALGQAI